MRGISHGCQEPPGAGDLLLRCPMWPLQNVATMLQRKKGTEGKGHFHLRINKE